MILLNKILAFQNNPNIQTEPEIIYTKFKYSNIQLNKKPTTAKKLTTTIQPHRFLDKSVF